MKTILSIMGTRPEIIKVAPVIRALEQNKGLRSLVLSTSQHRQMSEQFFDEFGITPDYDLDVMAPKQTLAYLTSEISKRLDQIFVETKPDAILVQGDTTTAYVSGLIAFYHKIPVGHIEAGLRTNDPYFPFPEELNRQMLSRLASLNFVPTLSARKNLERENIPPDTILYTGNTIVDALRWLIDNDPELKEQSQTASNRDMILVTAHRRENLGKPMKNICQAILEIVKAHSRVEIVFPVHPNPRVREIVFGMLDDIDRIRLMEPVNYRDLINYMMQAKIILTDSGGIQEESPTLKKPVLVMRNETERPEVVEVGGAALVGVDTGTIVAHVNELLTNDKKYRSMADSINPFGDGYASERIVEGLLGYFNMPVDDPMLPLEQFYEKT